MMLRKAIHQATSQTSRRSLLSSSTTTTLARTFVVSSRVALRSTGDGSSKSSPPSPAERPPSVPADPPRRSPSGGGGVVGNDNRDTFDPIVNDLSKPDGPHVVSSSGPTTASQDDVGTTASSSEKIDLSSLPSLDIDPTASLPSPTPTQQPEHPAGRTGARAKPSLSSIERKRRNLLRMTLATILVGGAVGAAYLSEKDVEVVGPKGEQEKDNRGAYERFKANLADLLDYFNKPAFDKLLPDPLPAPHQRPYTLLIDLEGFLVHSSWDRSTGWRTAKRPGVDYFLAYLSQFYEIVLFTTQPSYTAMGVADKLDPFQAYLPYKLYRESTRYVKGKIVKDLSYLNRDLSKVILIDTNPEHVALQPENAIVVKSWDGKPGDKGLVDLIPFLESIGIFAPPDVRPILKAYQGKDIPIEYAKREAERKRAAIEEWEREHGTGAVTAGAGAGWLSKLFGSLGGNTVPRQTQPMTYLEAKRAQAQKMYQEEQEYWAKNADEIRRLMEEDRQKQLAEQKGSLLGFLGGGPLKAADQPAK